MTPADYKAADEAALGLAAFLPRWQDARARTPQPRLRSNGLLAMHFLAAAVGLGTWR